MTPCVEWEGARTVQGYGVTQHPDGYQTTAHRVAYERERGPIPDGLEIDHLCRNRSCVNVEHLEVVTHAENMRRGWWAKREACAHGHPLDGVVRRRNGEVHRYCKTCSRARDRRRYQEHREELKAKARAYRRRKRAEADRDKGGNDGDKR